MATQPPPAAPVVAAVPPPPMEIRIYSHSNLFYWWPVWLVGLILALLTAFQHTVMVTIPEDAGFEVTKSEDNKPSVTILKATPLSEEGVPHLKATTHKGYGVLFAIVL